MSTPSKAGLSVVVCLIAGSASCAENEQPAGAPAPAPQPAPPPVVAKSPPARPLNVVAKLRFRDVDLVITRARTGPRFTVVDHGGMSLGTNLEEADLRTQHPDLYSAYRFGYARGPFLDARLDLPRENQRSPDGL